MQTLLEQTLDPLIEDVVRDHSPDKVVRDHGPDKMGGEPGPNKAVKALLKLRIIDPACGSGHFLLAAGRRIATRLAQLEQEGAPRPDDFRRCLREVARRCLFGVDKNPLAIELAKVALWIETVEPGKPLSFLDAHLRCGDSLFGVFDTEALARGIPDDAYKALTGDDKKAATFWRKKNQAEREAPKRGEFDFSLPKALYERARKIEAQPEEALADVEAKAAAYQDLLTGEDRYRIEVAADLYAAAFLLPKAALQPKTAQPRTADGEPAHIPTTAAFFANLIDEQRLSAFIDFENRERLFASVYFRVRFCLLALSDSITSTRFSCLLTNPAQVNDSKRRFTLTPDEIRRINPNTRTAPVFRSQADAELTKQIYDRVPVLIDEGNGEAGNPWGISFARLFDMSNDSKLFTTTRQMLDRAGGVWQVASDQGLLPLYEAKMIHQFNDRYADFALAKEKGDADYREIPQADAQTLADPAYRPLPRYWVAQAEVDARLNAKGWTRNWLMGWRDITNATNERTVIASAIPRVGCGDKFLLMFPEIEPEFRAALLATMNSMSFDFIARQKVGGTSLKYFTMKQLAAPRPDRLNQADLDYILPRVIELTYTSHAMAPFAQDLGYDGPPFKVDADRRAILRAELDAWIARLYGLTRDQLRYILDPTEIYGPDYPSETFRVLKKNEMKRYEEYRTARLTLAAWDEQNRKAEVA